MADYESKSLEQETISVDLSKLASSMLKLEECLPKNGNQVIRPGSQLSDKIGFRDKMDNIVSAYPVIVDFRRLLQLQNGKNSVHDNSVIPGISNSDLLHVVVGLYDVALSEMTLDVLYSTVCDKWARTIVLVQDVKDVLVETEVRKRERIRRKQNTEENDNVEENTAEGEDEIETEVTDDNKKDVYEEEEGQPSKFEDVFSDTDDEEEEDGEAEDSEEEEDFSTGINSFIKSAGRRRKARNKTEGIQGKNIGAENRIIGCLTFEKKYLRNKERVIHLTILTVRPRCRKYGIGKYLLSQVIDPAVSGQYEAVVVHADSGAVDFFQKFGFSDDVVLNSKWSELAEQFTNCTLMCYLPGFTGHTILNTINLPGLEVYEMDQELKKWKEKTLESYQAQITCVTRMRSEILHLQKKVKSQDDMIKMLEFNNEKTKQDKSLLEKEFLSYKLSHAQKTVKRFVINDDTEDEISTEDLISELQRQVNIMDVNKRKIENCSRLGFGDNDIDVYTSGSLRSPLEPYDHMLDAVFFYDVTQQFMDAMHSDPKIKIQYEVTSVNKSTVSREVRRLYCNRKQSLHDPNMVTKLYYCGGLEKPERLHTIMQTGFTEEDFFHGEYGKGIYFSKYPSKAAQFSALGQIVVVEVGLGSVQTVIKPDTTRQKTSDGWDSIIVPGRLKKHPDCDTMLNQEYVIFNSNQILPLCLINYKIANPVS